MKGYQTILFDLDGTLTDPGIGITNSVMYALMKYGIRVEKREDLYPFIGPPLADSFMKYYGFTSQRAQEAVEYYREYFREYGIFENALYPGILQMLETLCGRGKSLILATSKPEEFARRILSHFGLDSYFSFIAGASMDRSRSEKEAVIAYALAGGGVTEPERAVMVGDRKYDILGGRRFGMYTVGVTYGYGSRGELTEAGAHYLADDVGSLLEILIKNENCSCKLYGDMV